MRTVQEESWLASVDDSAVIVDAEAYYACLYEALSRARSQVLIAGWQFDTQVALLRGEAAKMARYPVRFLELLNAICDERPALEVYVLAWDYSVIYALEREWMQGFKFAFQAGSRVHFEFDAHPHIGGSHHQKFVVVDDALAFVGGLDICDQRWDDRQHREGASERVDTSGAPYRPNHELQAMARGPVVARIRDEFVARWRSKERAPLRPAEAATEQLRHFDFHALFPDAVFPIQASQVALLRTWPAVPPSAVPARETQTAYAAAVLAAEKLIYIETQYFTSRSLADALITRLGDANRSRLQIIAVLPRGADNSKEAFAIADVQHHLLGELRAAAEAHGHELCLLCSRRGGHHCEETTFIHSKLLLVDDEFLAVGSANMTERSMGLDTELGFAWQGAVGSVLSRSLRELRSSLLAEHSGLGPESFIELEGLVARIRRGIGKEPCRLIDCPVEPATASAWKNAVFDPGSPAEWSDLAGSLWASEDGDRLSRGDPELRAELARKRSALPRGQ